MEALVEIEAIRQLKYRYLRGVDTKDWALVRATLTPDCVSAYDKGHYAFEGADAIIDFLETTLGHPGVVSLHQVHHPEIEILSDTRARGRCPRRTRRSRRRATGRIRATCRSSPASSAVPSRATRRSPKRRAPR